MAELSFRFAVRENTPKILAFIRALAEYEQMADQVVASEELLEQQLFDQNAAEVLNAIAKLKPQALKGTYMQGASICTTMSPGIKIDLKAFLNGAE